VTSRFTNEWEGPTKKAIRLARLGGAFFGWSVGFSVLRSKGGAIGVVSQDDNATTSINSLNRTAISADSPKDVYGFWQSRINVPALPMMRVELQCEALNGRNLPGATATGKAGGRCWFALSRTLI